MMLEAKNLNIAFGGLKAVDDFNISIKKGELHGLIGPNGAGKTTLVNSIVGIVKSSSGTITFDGKDITHVPAHAMTKEGIGISPEGGVPRAYRRRKPAYWCICCKRREQD